MDRPTPGFTEDCPPGRFFFRPPCDNRCEIDPRLPHEMVEHFCAIDFRALAQRGITKVCLDLDNTLLAQTAEELDAPVVQHLHTARKEGWIENLCLISNVIVARGRRGARLRRLAQELEISLVYGAGFRNRKPSPVPFEWALQVLQAYPRQTAMIGDQIFSDVVGGNRMGFYTILVKPISSDHWTTRIVGRRWRESLLLRHYGLIR